MATGAHDDAPRHDAAHVGLLVARASPLRVREEYLTADRGKLAGAGKHSYSAGDATAGSEEAARFTDR